LESERRSERRLDVDDVSSIQILNPIAPDRWRIRILNTSARGLCVATSTFLPPGAEVRVFLRNVQLFGTIRYCEAAISGFRAGIELTERIGASRLTRQLSAIGRI